MFRKLEINRLKEKIKTLEALLIKHNVYEKERRLQLILKNKSKNK